MILSKRDLPQKKPPAPTSVQFMAATLRDVEKYFEKSRTSEGRRLWHLVRRALALYEGGR